MRYFPSFYYFLSKCKGEVHETGFLFIAVIKEKLCNLWNKESSRPGEFHPQSLTEPYVTVSRHPAPIVRSNKRPYFIRKIPPIAG